MNFAINYIYLSTDILGIATLILIILGVIFFKCIKKYTKSYDSQYTIAIFIFSDIFKLVFFSFYAIINIALILIIKTIIILL